MEKDINCLEIELAEIIQANQEKEAQAVKGYTKQLAIIDELINAIDFDERSKDKLVFLQELKEATEEKISDELNHQQGLLMEYVEFTGIQINKD
jgi:hypothetical protein